MALVNDSVSTPTSRWSTMALASVWRYSMGSSTVMMWQARVLVDVVDHGGQGGGLARAGGAGDEHQATLFLGQTPDDLGRPSSSILEALVRTRRTAMATEPRW